MRYLSREEQQDILDRLAAAQGLTREEFDAHLDRLGAVAADTEDHEHLSFMEATNFSKLSTARQTEILGCEYCEGLRDAVSPSQTIRNAHAGRAS